jgi:hypothetical protein
MHEDAARWDGEGNSRCVKEMQGNNKEMNHLRETPKKHWCLSSSFLLILFLTMVIGLFLFIVQSPSPAFNFLPTNDNLRV